jgi:DNA helicase IV
MKQYIKINIASPKNILEWTERLLPDGKSIGEITKSMRFTRIKTKSE